jgi:hypothetical protein
MPGARNARLERKQRKHWQSIGRTDLLEDLDREFPPEPAAKPPA